MKIYDSGNRQKTILCELLLFGTKISNEIWNNFAQHKCVKIFFFFLRIFYLQNALFNSVQRAHIGEFDKSHEYEINETTGRCEIANNKNYRECMESEKR